MWEISKFKNINNYLDGPLIPILVTIIISLYNLRNGVSLSPDSHRYISAANNLINLDFNYFLFFENYLPQRFFPVILPISLIAFLKTVSPDTWMNYFVYVNTLFLFISIYFFQKAMLSLNINNVVASICIFALIFSFDYLTWPRYILTDTIFSSLSFLLIYFTLAIRDINFRKILIWLICLLLLAITRQNCIPIIAVAIFLLFTHNKNLNGKVMLILFFTLFLTCALIFAVMVTALSSQTDLSHSQQIIEFINYAKSGVVIHHRPETYIELSNDIWSYSKLFCYRFFSFFSPYAFGFSTLHILFNSLIITIYALGLIISFWTQTQMSQMQKQYFIKLNLFIFAIAIFQSSTLIDFDWRYRFPAIILMVFVGAISLQSMLNRPNQKP